MLIGFKRDGVMDINEFATKGLLKRILEIRKQFEKKSLLYYMLPIVIFTLFVVYYLPIFGIPGLPADKYVWIEERLYGVIDPFRTAPVIVGITLILIVILYKDFLWKVVYFSLYTLSMVLPLVAVGMGYSGVSDLLIFVPHVIIVALVLGLRHLEKKKFSA